MDDLIRKAQNGCKKSRHKLILDNMGLVQKIASKYPREYFEDLCQEGYIAFNQAIDYHQFDKGCKLTSHAYARIKKHMKNKYTKMCNSVYSIYAQERYNEAIKLSDYGYSVEEIASVMNVSIKEIKELLDTECNLVYLNSKNEDGTYLIDIIQDDVNIQNQVENSLIKDSIFKIIDKERTKELFKLYFDYGYSHKEIGDMYGISHQRISKIIRDTLKQIRKEMLLCM